MPSSSATGQTVDAWQFPTPTVSILRFIFLYFYPAGTITVGVWEGLRTHHSYLPWCLIGSASSRTAQDFQIGYPKRTKAEATAAGYCDVYRWRLEQEALAVQQIDLDGMSMSERKKELEDAALERYHLGLGFWSPFPVPNREGGDDPESDSSGSENDMSDVGSEDERDGGGDVVISGADPAGHGGEGDQKPTPAQIAARAAEQLAEASGLSRTTRMIE